MIEPGPPPPPPGRLERTVGGDTLAAFSQRHLGPAVPVSALVWATLVAAGHIDEVRPAARSLALGIDHGAELVAGLALWVPADPAHLAASMAEADAQEAWLATVSIGELARAMAAGELSAVAVAEAMARRVAALERGGPRLGAVIALAPDLLEQAARLDAERAAGTVRGPLHGVPIVLKDNVELAAGWCGATGSVALANHPAAFDAPVAVVLREAGAVLAGVANLSEWSNFRSASSRSGYSARGGFTQPPHALGSDPCGSSSGSAVAVATGLAVAAVGSETFGSLGCPAGVNGVVTIKPTLGLLSGEGVVPIARSFDTLGPMARSVADLVELLEVMATAPGPARRPAGYGVRPDPHRRVRVGIDAGCPAFERLRAALADHGPVVPVELPAAELGDLIGTLISAVRRDLPDHLARRGAPSLAEVIDAHRADPAEAMFDDAYLVAAAGLPADRLVALEAARPPVLPAGAAAAPTLAAVLAEATGAPAPADADPLRSLVERTSAPDGADAEVSAMRHRHVAVLTDLLGAEGLDVVIMGDATAWSAAAGAPYAVVHLPEATGGWSTVHVLGAPFGEAQVLAVAGLVEAAAGPLPRPDFRFA